MIEILLVVLLVVVGGLVGLVLFLMKKVDQVGSSVVAPEQKDMMVLLNQNIQGMQSRLDNVSGGLNTRLDNAARVIQGVSRDLGQVHEMGRAMTDLQNFLRSPKLRGNIGERVLKDMLATYFPKDLYAVQHKFHDGTIVDAVIRTGAGIISIDSKFPLENFQKGLKAEKDEERLLHSREFHKDVKKHVDAIAKKYIMPEEGTVDFAVMYVPSESVFYHMISDDSMGDLNAYALQKNVLMVSPNSFFYFLRVALAGLQGKRIEEASQKIMDTLKALEKDARKVTDDLSVLNTHVSNTAGALSRLEKDYAKLAGKIDQTQLLSEPTKEV